MVKNSTHLFHFQKTPLALGVLAALQGLPAGTATAAPAMAGPEFLVNATQTTGAQNLPSVAMDDGGDYVVAWTAYGGPGNDNNYGIYARQYAANGVPKGPEFLVNTTTTNAQDIPRVAMDHAGNFVVVWAGADQSGGDGWDIYAQRYAANGAPVGGEFLVNTKTTGDQYFPVVAMDTDGDFVVAWADKSSNQWDISAQRYNNAGVAQGAEFLVNTHTTDTQYYPAVGMDTDGDFVVVWQSSGQDGSGYGVYARRYNASGVAQDTLEFQVNQTTVDWQYYPATAVAIDDDGDFLVAWTSYLNTVDGGDIYARYYQTNGTAVTNEFKVNTTTTDFQNYPAVAMDAQGDFAVIWTSFGQDGSAYGIYGQRYSANCALAGCTSQGGEFRINTTTTDQQWLPAVAMDAKGNFVVAWANGTCVDCTTDPPAYDWDIYAQRYARPKVYTVVPCRVADSRITGTPFSGQMQPNTTRNLLVTGNTLNQGGATDCGIPSSATAVFLNLTAVLPADTGYLTLYPSGEARPLASTLNFQSGRIAIANGVLVPQCDPAREACAANLSITNTGANSKVDVVVDVTGYLAAPPI